MSKALHYKVPLSLDAPATDPKHAVPKGYVDDLVQGLLWDPVVAAATENLAGTVGDGGLSITGSANGQIPSIDGVTATVGDRVLLPAQSDKTQNGIYRLTDAGSADAPWRLERSADADVSKEFRPGKRVYVMPEGQKNGGVNFKLVTGATIVVGTSAIEFAIDIDTEKVRAEKHEIVGDGSKAEFTITHGLATKNVLIQIRDVDDDVAIFATSVPTDSTITVSSATALENGEKYSVIIMGMAG